MKKIAAALLISLVSFNALAQNTARVKDITTIAGVRANQIFGYGLVIGLDGTGDKTTQTPFTSQSTMTMLAQQGINLPEGIKLQTKNVASVMVTALLPAFASPGQAIDVTVSSIGNAKSLRGGTLLVTPLKGVDGKVYALAQGQVVIGGAGAESGGSSKKVNQLSSGRVPSGALVERGVGSPFASDSNIRLELTRTDFGDSFAISESINMKYGEGVARAIDGRTIELQAPPSPELRVQFMAMVNEIPVNSSTPAAKVIINSKTGSVAMNEAVKMSPVAISHGNLTVEITNTPLISQPGPLSGGSTVVANQTDIKIERDGGEVVFLEGASSLNDLVKGLNRLGTNTDDLISILQAIERAGSMRASIEVI